jgi:hypothetical protein
MMIPASGNVDVLIPRAPKLPSNTARVNWSEVERVAQFERTAYLQSLITIALAQR